MSKLLSKRLERLEEQTLSYDDYVGQLSVLAGDDIDLSDFVPQPYRVHEEWVEQLD